MGKVVLLVVLVGVLLLGGALLLIGAFPPNPKPETVSHVLNNDRFQTH